MIAVGETVILLHPPPHLVGVSIVMERNRQQNDSLADGYTVIKGGGGPCCCCQLRLLETACAALESQRRRREAVVGFT